MIDLDWLPNALSLKPSAIKRAMDLGVRTNICGECGAPTAFNSHSWKFDNYCSKKCRYIHTQKNVANTCKKRYGASSALASPRVRDKIRSTCIQKYGVPSVTQSRDFQDRVHKTNMSKYGSVTPVGNKDIQKKIRRTLNVKFGGNSSFSSDTVREKSRLTIRKRYGVDNVFANDVIQTQISDTNFEKYGVKNPVQNVLVRNKIRDTNLMRYGVGSHAELNAIDWTPHRIALLSEMINSGFSCAAVADCLGLSTTSINHKAHDLGLNLIGNISSLENKIISIIPSHVSYNMHDRKVIAPKEIDFFFPEYNFGIEVGGSYWHSIATNTVSTYHYDKFKDAQNAGIRLLQLFDYELDDRRLSILADIIAVAIHGNDVMKVSARKCTIQMVCPSDARTFYNQFHWQGFTGARVHIGLYYNNELVFLMSFQRTRFSKTDASEIIRMSSRGRYVVRGAISKILTYYVNRYSPNKIITFSDNRLFSGSSYENAGFQKVLSKNVIGYQYVSTDGVTHYSRYQTQKHKLPKLLTHFDDNLSEEQNMKNANFFRLYDAGQTKWITK